MNNNLIESRKLLSRIIKESRNNAKLPNCLLCGKEKTSYCNSHSVPELVLKNISSNGKVIQANGLVGFEILDVESGVKEAGTFHTICHECDHKYFRDYEDYSYLVNYPTDKMLIEIALKNYLLQYSKRIIERQMFKSVDKEIKNPNLLLSSYYQSHRRAAELDIRDYRREIELCKSAWKIEETGGYQVAYWKLLPYRIPIAIQSAFAMKTDYNGTVIEDVFNLSDDEHVQSAHLCAFPLKDCSMLLVFYHKKDTKYRMLRRRFRNFTEEECVKYINWMIFKYTENYYISKSVQETIQKSLQLRELSRDYFDTSNFGMTPGYDETCYAPAGMDDIPNLLSIDFSITKEAAPQTTDDQFK